MPVSLPKETVIQLAQLRLINVLKPHIRKGVNCEEVAIEVITVLREELHFDVIDDK